MILSVFFLCAARSLQNTLSVRSSIITVCSLSAISLLGAYSESETQVNCLLKTLPKIINWSGKEIGSRCILALFEGNDASGRCQEPEPGGPGRDYARRCDQSTGCAPHQSSTPEFVCVSSPKYQSILNFLIFKFLNFRIFIFLISQFLKFSILIFEFFSFSI